MLNCVMLVTLYSCLTHKTNITHVVVKPIPKLRNEKLLTKFFAVADSLSLPGDAGPTRMDLMSVPHQTTL
jgi:hypothetical protein